MCKKLVPLKAKDCLDDDLSLPDLHEVMVALYNCARGYCKRCSRKSDNKCKRTDIGGCRFDLLEDANELLMRFEIERR